MENVFGYRCARALTRYGQIIHVDRMALFTNTARRNMCAVNGSVTGDVRRYPGAGYPTEVEAAWLHHRYISIHPFQDGNGRTARLLMAYVYIQRGEFPPVVHTFYKPNYIAVLEAADNGNLQPFAQYLSGLATIAWLTVSLLHEIRFPRDHISATAMAMVLASWVTATGNTSQKIKGTVWSHAEHLIQAS